MNHLGPNAEKNLLYTDKCQGPVTSQIITPEVAPLLGFGGPDGLDQLFLV